MKSHSEPPPEIVEFHRSLQARLPLDEFEARVRAPMDDFEREQMVNLIDWFLRRYPTPLQRLRYGRRAWRNAQRLSPYPDLLARRAWDTDA